MLGVEFQKSTKKMLEEPFLEGATPDEKIRQLLKSEYLRRMARYRHVDHLMVSKYGVSFEQFVARRIVKENAFSWDVESDAMDWETAISGIKTMERKLGELQQVHDVYDR